MESCAPRSQPQGSRAFAPRRPDLWPRSVAWPRSPACCGCHMRPRESPHLAWALAPRVTWLTLTSGRPCCWGASSSHGCKMRSEYLLGASAGLRRRYISIWEVRTLVMPLQWWSTLHTAVRVTAFIRFWV